MRRTCLHSLDINLPKAPARHERYLDKLGYFYEGRIEQIVVRRVDQPIVGVLSSLKMRPPGEVCETQP